MGFVSAFANLGSIGSTTRWAIKGYVSLKSNNKKLTDDQIFTSMISIRYESGDEGGYENYLKSKVQMLPGLAGLIIEILNLEADLYKNDPKFLHDMIEPIFNKLEQSELSQKTKYGKLRKSEFSFFIYSFLDRQN